MKIEMTIASNTAMVRMMMEELIDVTVTVTESMYVLYLYYLVTVLKENFFHQIIHHGIILSTVVCD